MLTVLDSRELSLACCVSSLLGAGAILVQQWLCGCACGVYDVQIPTAPLFLLCDCLVIVKLMASSLFSRRILFTLLALVQGTLNTLDRCFMLHWAGAHSCGMLVPRFWSLQRPLAAVKGGCLRSCGVLGCSVAGLALWQTVNH